MRKIRKPVDNRQQKISSFFLKQSSAKPSVLSDKTNPKTSPYFSKNVSPETVVLSDDDDFASKESPIKTTSNNVQNILNASIDNEQTSSKRDKCNIEGDLTPDHSSSVKRKLYDCESSPDVIPPTPKLERNESYSKNKKSRLNLNKLKLRRKKAESRMSPCKKLKYEEAENINHDNIKSIKTSPVEKVIWIDKFEEITCNEKIKDCIKKFSEVIELKNITKEKEIFCAVPNIKPDSTLEGNIKTEKSPDGKIQNLKSDNFTIKSDNNSEINCKNSSEDALDSNIISKTVKVIELSNKIGYSGQKCVTKTNETDESVKSVKQCSYDTDAVITNSSTEFIKALDPDGSRTKFSYRNNDKITNKLAESVISTELNEGEEFSDQNVATDTRNTDKLLKSLTSNNIKEFSNGNYAQSIDGTNEHEVNCRKQCSDLNGDSIDEGIKSIELNNLSGESQADQNRTVKCDMKLGEASNEIIEKQNLNLNKTIAAQTRHSIEEVSSISPSDHVKIQEIDIEKKNCSNILESSDWIKLDDWDCCLVEAKDEGAIAEETLNLETLQRCEVMALEQKSSWEKIMKLKSTQTKEIATCLVKDFWIDTSLSVGDIVSVKACRDGNTWVINNLAGLLVHHPDTLISSTSVVGSLFCPRRGVLSEWFRGIDGDSRIMVIGSLVHELLQEVLERKLVAESDILNLVYEILSKPYSIQMLYSSSMSKQETLSELEGFVPRIVKFVELYVHGIGMPDSGNFKGSICAIHDIEENIWEPKLGIKGKVDVTTEVKIHQRKKIMPLELKTGRPSFSAEHKGQVTLYTMMMSQLGSDVDAGLLLYLRDGQMQQIRSGNNEWRDLTILRNQLAHYITRIPAMCKENTSFKPPQLPEPICHPSACGKCPYLTLCSSFLRCDGLDKLPNSNPLSTMAISATSHLTSRHIDYLVHWTGLLLLEEAEMSSFFHQKDLWCMSPDQREKRGKCISSVVVYGKVVMSGDSYLCTLQKKSGDSDLQLSGFSVGDYIIVSTDKRLAIASGTVQDITHSSITLSLNRMITQKHLDCIFHIDTYTLQTGKVFNLTNLGCLMDDTESAEKLRRLIIDREKPTFVEKLHSSIMRPGKSVLKPLNMGQRRAVVMALTANDYFLIKGMPGTGKTATIVALVELLVKLGKSVVVTSHTHSAVDNVLLKLMARGVDFLRLGSSSRIHPQLAEKSEHHLTAGCTTPEQLESVYNSKLVVGTTCLGAGHPLFTRRKFDICIVDESTQVLQVSVFRPLFCAKKFVLIGDPQQLPPVIKSKKAKELGMSESLFVRLDAPDVTVCLDLQYRMNQAITEVANGLTYSGHLKCGSEEVSLATLQLPNRHLVLDELTKESWLMPVLSSSMEDSVLILDTGATCRILDQNAVGNFKELLERVSKEERGCTNLCEAAVIHFLITMIMKGGVSGSSIGIIAPYRAQVALLRKATRDIVEVNTVDQYQGRDKHVIIFSCTKSEISDSSENKENEILGDKRRLTVAITRAKQKLIIIGDVTTLKKYSPFSQLLECVSSNRIHVLSDGTNGFEWNSIMMKFKEASSSVL